MHCRWIITAGFAYFIFKTSLPTAMIIGACLSPTDPVLAASVLSKSKFSSRVPARLRYMLSAESACNDGVSFPFLYVGLAIFKEATTSEAIKEWFLVTILWQCTFGITIGIILGKIANFTLRFSDKKSYISRSSFVVFYLLMAALSVGVGSVLGSDDFLVAFGAGVYVAPLSHLPPIKTNIQIAALQMTAGSVARPKPPSFPKLSTCYSTRHYSCISVPSSLGNPSRREISHPSSPPADSCYSSSSYFYSAAFL